MRLQELKVEFREMFSAEPILVQAPGRVNLIGEHTDYNDGFVLPAAIPFHAFVAAARRADRRIRLFSKNYSERVEFDLEPLPEKPRGHWSDYPIGVARTLEKQGKTLRGADLLVYGDVPQGAGLSSSAAFEVAVCRALLEVSEITIHGAVLAQVCQQAENEFVGARCGIMDQFASVYGKKDHALLLDCRSLHYEYRPIPEEVRMVICNTMVRHNLGDGDYNQRRKECEWATNFFSERKAGVRALRDVSPADFETYAANLPENIRKRALHVISENLRVVQASEALADHDLRRFGRLMAESHASLRDNFEVSCEELDLMVRLAAEIDGVYGARMTGGGFGGSTINLVRRTDIPTFQAKVAAGYERVTGRAPEIFVCAAADGVGRLL